jgi:hypothetical protein
MEECCIYNIYPLYLPAHTSHVLQPLDLAVFGPWKASYRKWLSQLSDFDDSSAARKRNFLCCYEKARRSALSEVNKSRLVREVVGYGRSP